MHHHKRFIAFAALPAIVAAAVLLGPGASAQSGRTLTFTELEKGSTFIHIRNTKTKSPQSNSLGDVLAFTNPLADSSKRVVGKLHVNCTTTIGASNFLKSVITCSGILVLRDGTLTMQANVTPGAPTTTGRVTGGTGAYANARGTLVSKSGANGSTDTLALAG
jgi:hypothetical protein